MSGPKAPRLPPISGSRFAGVENHARRGVGLAEHGLSRPCLACARERSVDEFAAMPLWPEPLGGAMAPACFQTNAFCRDCRDLAQGQIDGDFLKSWCMQAEMTRAALAFIDPQTPGPAPLTYLGTAPDMPLDEGETCDRWAGLAGEAIYHIHMRNDAVWAGFGLKDAEAAPKRREMAVLALASPSRFWSTLALQSLAAHFPHADLYCINDMAALKGIEDDVTRGTPPRAARFLPANAGGRVLNARLQEDGSHRMLIKLALGLGHNLLGPAFAAHGFARRLRKMFWQRHPPAQAFAMDVPAVEVAGVWTLTLAATTGFLGLRIVSPAGRPMSVTMANDPALWHDLESGGRGLGGFCRDEMFIIIPQRRIFAGPLPVSACMAHQSGTAIVPEIARLEAMRVSPRQLPNRQGYA